MNERKRKREVLKARIALNRVKQQNEAISRIIEILAELPDYEIRVDTIRFLLRRLEEASPIERAEASGL